MWGLWDLWHDLDAVKSRIDFISQGLQGKKIVDDADFKLMAHFIRYNLLRSAHGFVGSGEICTDCGSYDGEHSANCVIQIVAKYT